MTETGGGLQVLTCANLLFGNQVTKWTVQSDTLDPTAAKVQS